MVCQWNRTEYHLIISQRAPLIQRIEKKVGRLSFFFYAIACAYKIVSKNSAHKRVIKVRGRSQRKIGPRN